MSAQKPLTAAELARIEARIRGADDPLDPEVSATRGEVARLLQDLRALLGEVKRLRGRRRQARGPAELSAAPAPRRRPLR